MLYIVEVLYIVDSNHLVHLMWHMAAAKIRKESGDKEAMPDQWDVLDWFLIRLDNLRNHWKTIGPCQCVAVFDSPARTFRKDLYENYKGGRVKVSEVYESVADAQQALRHSDEWGMIASPSGFEADDLMASIAHQHDGDVTIHSPDKDMNQCLVDGRVTIIKRSSQEDSGLNDYGLSLGSELMIEAYDMDDWKMAFPFPHERWIDYQCLVGDTADNIQGAKWIGHVAACRILTMIHPDAGLEELCVSTMGLNKRQEREWHAFIERLPVLRELFTLRTDLEFQI